MPRGGPKGNKYALGNRGGGRKSAYQEFLDAQWHYKAWQGEIEEYGIKKEGKVVGIDVKKLAEKIKKGVYSVKEMFLYKAITGNDRALATFTNKILPDLTMLMGPTGGAVEVDLKGEAKKRSAKYHGANDATRQL